MSVHGGVLAPGGVSAPGGVGPGGIRGCLVETPPRTATAAGGTHPTGMHSCIKVKLYKISINDPLL